MVASSTTPVRPMQGGKHQVSDCDNAGMELWDMKAASAPERAAVVKHVEGMKKSLEKQGLKAFLATTSKTQWATSYVCSLRRETGTHAALRYTAKDPLSTNRISNAEVGKYVITYAVADKAGNDNLIIRNGRIGDKRIGNKLIKGTNCERATPYSKQIKMSGREMQPELTAVVPEACKCKYKKEFAEPTRRTIVVRDTLPPVLTLHFGKQLIHTSQSLDTGIGGEVNPASYHQGKYKNFPYRGNPNLLMAEEESSTATNGWIVAAAASAVTGLALLGYSQRKSTITTVPV